MKLLLVLLLVAVGAYLSLAAFSFRWLGHKDGLGAEHRRLLDAELV